MLPEKIIMIYRDADPRYTKIWAMTQVSWGTYRVFWGMLGSPVKSVLHFTHRSKDRRNLLQKLNNKTSGGYEQLHSGHPLYQQVTAQIEQNQMWLTLTGES
jgi:hypothetical protein